LKWTFKNTGETEWPADIKFVQINGDALVTSVEIDAVQIKPEQELTFTQQITCPAKPGLYSGFFKLAHGSDSIEFGEKVYIDIKVNEADPAQKNLLLLRSQ